MRSSRAESDLSDVELAALSPATLARFVTHGRWAPAKHLRLLNRKLMEVAFGKCRRLVIQTPPRHGKSELVSRHFPAWYLGTFPDRRIILASYEASFAESWGGRARDTLEEVGKSVFGVKVREDRRAASWWAIAGHEGYMATAGVGGPITGKGADVIVIDDPIKNMEEAQSKLNRDKQWEWFQSVAYTRLEPNGAIVIVMTRWHEDDLVGRLLDEAKNGRGEAWEVVRLPAIAEEASELGDSGAAVDALGRAPGVALWPSRFNVDNLASIKRTVGSYTWSALYQQRPSPLGGGLFKRDWFKYYTTHGENGETLSLGGRLVSVADDLRRFAIVDLAASQKTTADYTVISSWGATEDGQVVLLDVDRARREGPDIVPAMQRAVDAHALAFVGVEKVGFQLALIQEAWRAGLPIRELVADRDKIARALPATAAMEGGRVWFPKTAHWLDEFTAELISFPSGAHDDQVDTLGYAIACVGEHPDPAGGTVSARDSTSERDERAARGRGVSVSRWGSRGGRRGLYGR